MSKKQIEEIKCVDCGKDCFEKSLACLGPNGWEYRCLDCGATWFSFHYNAMARLFKKSYGENRKLQNTIAKLQDENKKIKRALKLACKYIDTATSFHGSKSHLTDIIKSYIDQAEKELKCQKK